MVVSTVNLGPTKEIGPTETGKEPIEDPEAALKVENDGKKLGKDEGNCPEQNLDPGNILISNNDPITPTLVDETDVIPEGKEPPALITIKVKDVVGVLAQAEAQLFVYTTETTFGEFFIDVSCRFNIELGEFDIIYQDKFFSYTLAGFPDDHTFSELNVKPDRDKVYYMNLDLPPKKRKSKGSDPSKETVTRKNLCNDMDVAMISSGLSIMSCGRDYVGLKNRNMTCYLNSFLQGLWFTPEFRNVIYNYHNEPSQLNRKSLCVPLQKLFLLLQLSSRDSIDTDELIKTFGWEDRETWNQHDIEELCSIFMDNLQTEFKGTPMEGIIQALYFGTLDDYVKCLECGRVSQRTDDFLVIPLPIRNFGSLLANPTLEAALNSFVAYEILDGNNLYNCSQCEKPCPAHKGFKFNRLPYILSFQLKRFEYDFIKDRRMKLNDRVQFPFILDMNPYIENPSGERKEALKIDLLRPKSMDGGRSEGHSRPSISMKEDEDSSDTTPQSPVGGAAGGSESERPSIEEMKALVEKNGPEIYQLYGVMVHRGGINSGHYYAYVFDFERDKWFRCDDAVIRKASISDIEVTYGGVSDEDRELTSAYMLLYRRFDPELNLLPYYLEEMPPHIHEVWTATVELDKQLQAEEELAKNTIRMNCFMRDAASQELIERILQIPKTMSVADAAVLISQEFADMQPLPETISDDKLRLCRFDKDLLIIESSFDGLEEENIVVALRKLVPRTKNEGLFLERKRNGLIKIKLPFSYFSSFPVHSISRSNFNLFVDIVFRTHLADCQQQFILPPREVHALPTSSVNELKGIIRNELELAETEIIVVTQYMGHFTTVIGDKHPLTLFNFERINDIYAQPGSEVDLSDTLLRFVEQYTKAEVILIYAQVPPTPIAEETGPVLENVDQAKSQVPSSPPPVEIVDTKAIEVAGEATPTPILNGNLETEPETSISLAAPPKTDHFIQIACQGTSTEDNLLVYTLRIDGQTPLYSLSKFLSELISVPEPSFVLYKADKTETVELRRMTDRIAILKPFDHLYLKLEPRLQDGESRIAVFSLDICCPEKPIQYLTEFVATLGMTPDEVRTAIISKCESHNCDVKVDRSRLRIRKKLRSNPSKILREHMKLQDLFTSYSVQTGELFVQLVDDVSSFTEKNYSMIYRQWHPSTGALDPPVEVALFHDYSADLEDVILAKLRESLGYTEEVELEVVKPDTGFPWDIPPRLIPDLGWFSLTPAVKKSLYVYSDELALFVRKKGEPMIELEKLEAFQPRYASPTAVSPTPSSEPQRRETGLKLNLSKPSPSN